MANQQQQQQQPVVQVVEVRVKQDRSVLWFLMFGWWYPLFLLARWSVRTTVRLVTWPFRAGAWLGWKTLVEWPWRAGVAATRWTIAGTRKAWPYVVASGRRFHDRFGAKGWAIAGGALVLLVLLGSLTTHH